MLFKTVLKIIYISIPMAILLFIMELFKNLNF